MRQCQTLCQPIVYKSRLYRHHVDVPPASIRRGARRRHCNTIECPAATSPSCPQHRDRPGRKSSSYGNLMITREHYEYDASSVGIDPEPRCPGKVVRDSFLPHNSSSPRRRRRQIVVDDGAGAAPSTSDPNSRQTRAKPTPLGQDGGQKTPYQAQPPLGKVNIDITLATPKIFGVG